MKLRDVMLPRSFVASFLWMTMESVLKCLQFVYYELVTKVTKYVPKMMLGKSQQLADELKMPESFGLVPKHFLYQQDH